MKDGGRIEFHYKTGRVGWEVIALAEIKRAARAHGVGVETIEKDYCLGWFLKGLSEHPFLKTREVPGETAWEARINFTGSRLQDRFPRRFKVDITAYEKIHLKPLLKKVHHPYSDTFSARVYVYAIEEIVAEKLRTILRRGYPRDLYDAWYILARGRSSLPIDIAKVKTTFAEKCEYKKVRFSGPGQFLDKTRRQDMERHWQNSIQRQLRDIPSFQTVASDLEKRLKELFVK